MATYFIDDQDLSKVTYNGTWIRGGSSYEYNETVASSTEVGDFFTVSFRGTNIAVFGTFDLTSAGVETSYSIDGSSPVIAVSQAGSGDVHRQQFWRSDPLAIGDHKLVVNLTKVNVNPQAGEGTVWFDYFLITDPTITGSNSTSPDTLQPSVSATSRPSQNDSHTGEIIGGVLGGLFFLLGVVFLVLFFLRRKKRVLSAEEGSPGDNSHLTADRRATMIEPFRLTISHLPLNGLTDAPMSMEFDPARMVAEPPTITSRKSIISDRPGTVHSTQASIGNSSTAFLVSDEPLPSLNTGDTQHPSRDLPPNHDKRRPRLHAEQNISNAPAVPHTALATAEQTLEVPPLQHIDSGIRASNASSEALGRVELPPVYSPS
ncbi:hypothetical protein H0H93_004390 [Arthromyces matolae]|nr:hypothetical protein H0H93_004390 [Arthromyces matolae]